MQTRLGAHIDIC